MYLDGPRSSQGTSLKICIIGGGSAGLSAIQVIKDSEQYKSGLWSVDAYEGRDGIGGVWYKFESL